MNGKYLLALCACASTSALTLAATPVKAETQLQEVIVTAEKRATNIQTTPIAMSAISGDQLKARQITNVESLTSALPNVDFGQQLGNARIAIRGIGFDNTTGGNEARVAYHQDGVYFSRPYSVTPSFYDVDRVEVLRGPQGTLYGRNATAGVVNVITRAPGSALNGYLDVTGANYGEVKVDGAIGGPITDILGARFAFQTDDRDGYGRNETTGNPNNDMHTYSMRGKVLFKPTDYFDVTLFGDYSHEKDHADNYDFIAQNPYITTGVLGPEPVSGTLFGGALPSKPRDSAGIDTHNERQFKGAGGIVNLKALGLDFTSITAWRAAEYHITGNASSASAPYLDIDQFEHSKQYSEEFRVAYTADKYDWMLGGYYFNESLETGNRFAADILQATFFFDPTHPATACGNHTRPCTAADLDPRGVSAAYQPQGRLKTEAYAAFANFHYKFTDQLGLRLGARYSEETKTVHSETKYDFAFHAWPSPGFPSLPLPACTPLTFCLAFPPQDASQKYSSFTPSATLDYQATRDLYLYFTYSKGFKSGGFNVGNEQPAFAPEKITDYEGGIKAQWFDRRLQTNLAAFYYDYTNIQATVVIGSPVPTVQTINAPGATEYGIEFDTVARPIDGMELNANFGWLKSRYNGPFHSYAGFPTATAAPLGGFDLAGNQLVYAPKFTFDLGAQYTWNIGMLKVTPRAEASYRDRTYYDIFNSPAASQPSVWKANAFLTVAPQQGNWSAELFVRNLTDKRTVTAVTQGAAFAGSAIVGAFAPPRTFGVTLSYKLH